MRASSDAHSPEITSSRRLSTFRAFPAAIHRTRW